MKHWTREGWIESIQRPMTYDEYEAHAGSVIDDLLAERDALASQPKPDQVTYRLPDWLGGHQVEIVDEMVGWGFPAVTVQTAGAFEAPEPMVVARSWLVEVRPPSIDDPVGLPLKAAPDIDGDQLIAKEGGGGLLFTVLDPQQGISAQAVVRGDDLLKLAQAAWQRWRETQAGA